MFFKLCFVCFYYFIVVLKHWLHIIKKNCVFFAHYIDFNFKKYVSQYIENKIYIQKFISSFF